MTVNNFFGDWFTDFEIRRYPDDKIILPTNNSLDNYQYSNAQLKYLPEESVKTLLKTILYSNKLVYLDTDVHRRANNNNDDNKRSDPNLTYRIAHFKDYIFEKHAYRIPLSLIVVLGLINFAMKNEAKVLITLERDLNKLFETNVKAAAISTKPTAIINIYDRLYIFIKN